MVQITVEKNVNGIEGLCIITPAVHGDSRGHIVREIWKRLGLILHLFRTISP